MTVFDLRGDPRFAPLKSRDQESAFAWSRRFDGTRLTAEWKPLEVAIDESDIASNPGDFPDWGAIVPVFSQRAIDALGDLLDGRGELLPLRCAEGPFWAFNVTAVIDALDEERSRIKRFASTGRIMQIDRYVFVESIVRGQTIFKIPQLRTSDVFVTEVFADRIADRKLEGFRLTPLLKKC